MATARIPVALTLLVAILCAAASPVPAPIPRHPSRIWHLPGQAPETEGSGDRARAGDRAWDGDRAQGADRAWAGDRAQGADRSWDGDPRWEAGREGPAGGRSEWTFSANLRIHPDQPGQHIWPDIAAAPGGTLGIAWMDDHESGYHIYYSFSTDGGASWSTPERVDDRTTGTYSKFVSLAFTPYGMAVAVWEDDRGGSYNLYISRRDPEVGTPWTQNVQVNSSGSPPSGSDFMNGSLAVLDEDRYFIAWTDWREGVFHQVYMRATWDGGTTWGPESRVSDGLGYEPVAGDPCLIVDPASGPDPGQEILYCVTNDWRGNVPGGRYPNVYFYKSADGGATWTVGVQVNDVEELFQQVSSHALCLLEDGVLACGWLNNPDLSVNRQHVSHSSDGGATWGPSVPMNDPAAGGTGTISSIATDGVWLFAVFDVYETNWNAYFRAASDGGHSWPDPMVRMDDDAGSAATANPVVAVTGPQSVQAAWSDNRSPGSNWKVYTSTGTRTVSGVAWSGDGDRGQTLRILPNPSRPGQVVRSRGQRDLRDAGIIYAASGRIVIRLRPLAGELRWDGRDGNGRIVPPGWYWLHIPGAVGQPGGPIVRLP